MHNLTRTIVSRTLMTKMMPTVVQQQHSRKNVRQPPPYPDQHVFTIVVGGNLTLDHCLPRSSFLHIRRIPVLRGGGPLDH